MWLLEDVGIKQHRQAADEIAQLIRDRNDAEDWLDRVAQREDRSAPLMARFVAAIIDNAPQLFEDTGACYCAQDEGHDVERCLCRPTCTRMQILLADHRLFADNASKAKGLFAHYHSD